jgi:long-chain fatty acid transport protein
MRGLALGVVLSVICDQTAFAQFGAQFSGVGPINRSMGGASTAAPLDTLGAFQWNPATITALPSSTDMALEILVPSTKLSSTVSAGALGGGFPPATLSGSNVSNTGAYPLPAFGFVFQPDESPLSFGIGAMAVSGFGVNFPGSTTNPILTAPPPNGLGVGPIYSQYEVVQIIPTIAYRVTEKLSVGFSPMIDLASLSLNPGFLAAPDAAGGGFATFPPMTNGPLQWGGGFQVGAYYVTERNWNFGASFKSTQWFQSFDYNSRGQTGAPREVKVGVDVPMIVSIGTAYTGLERTLIAVDARYIDYRNTKPFSQSGFTPAGAVAGVGWDSIFALSAGAQYQLSDPLSVRMGYSYNTNPISNDKTFFNIASPLLLQHTIYVGASYNLNASLKLSLAYIHAFENSSSGPIVNPVFGPLAGTNVTSTTAADAVSVGASICY